jgi:hypothetical protein
VTNNQQTNTNTKQKQHPILLITIKKSKCFFSNKTLEAMFAILPYMYLLKRKGFPEKIRVHNFAVHVVVKKKIKTFLKKRKKTGRDLTNAD